MLRAIAADVRLIAKACPSYAKQACQDLQTLINNHNFDDRKVR